MRLTVSTVSAAEQVADWLIVPVWEGEKFHASVAELDRLLGGLLTTLRERGDHVGKFRELSPILQASGLAASRLLVLGLGKRDKADVGTLVQAGGAAGRLVSSKEIRRIAMLLPEPTGSIDADARTRALAVGFRQGCDSQALRKAKRERHTPEELIFVGDASDLARADSECRATALARELVNQPPCDLYPETFAERVRSLCESAGLDCEIWDEPRIRAEKMAAILAVAKGSERPPRFCVLRHLQGGQAPTLALVGKGVTFDSGGLSLKTNEQMIDMKCDMAGAATVLASMLAIAELKLPVNVIGVMALVENMPGGRAMKLGDVIQARNGKTIEVLNTDAEGRLILADALAYAVDAGASHLVDLATLTGACLVALGSEVAGVMSNHEEWEERLLAAAQAVGEKAWPLPMFPMYGEMIKGGVADIRNTGGSRYAGAITAAKFLEEFVAEKPWVHLDIAGPAWAEKENASRDAGGTGCFVRTLIELATRYR